MKKTVYTIGYTAFDINDFIDVLKFNKITCLIDVRSSPYSEFYSNYNKGQLDVELKKNNILYRNYINSFGARQENSSYYHSKGYLDFNKFIVSEQFLEGVDKIEKGIELGYTFCLMCAETNPITCHRSIMVSRGLKDNNFDILHILKGGELLTHSQLEEQLLDKHFENRNQLSLYSNYGENDNSIETETEEELLKLAYDKQNEIIGFRKNNEED